VVAQDRPVAQGRVAAQGHAMAARHPAARADRVEQVPMRDRAVPAERRAAVAVDPRGQLPTQATAFTRVTPADARAGYWVPRAQARALRCCWPSALQGYVEGAAYRGKSMTG
jgi:hypothetical protein